jgi:hypothetical protein
MLSIALQIVECVSFIALLVLVWRVSKRPRWRIRAVIYGWAAFFVLSVFWCFLMPTVFSRVMDLHLPVATFPDGTFAMFALVFGWMWPAIIVGVSSYLERRKRGDDHVV